jgi:hypothetical protein
MARSLLFSGSLIVLVGALGLTGGCSADQGKGGSAGSGNSSSTGSGEAGATSSTSTGGGMGGAGGSVTGTGGAGGAGGSVTGTGGAGGSVTGTGGAGGIGGAGGAGGIGGAGGAAGAGGAGGQGGSMVPVDQDGDGWTIADGDCCDSPLKCSKPEKVNPGAFEYLGNGVDDDCNPATPDDQPAADCTDPPLATPTSSLKLVKAMDLCQFTTENPPLPQKKWGVISSSLILADGVAGKTPKDVQVGVLAKYGPNVLPKKGATMAALSTGTARAEGDPGFVHPQNGPMAGQDGSFEAGTKAPAPASYVAANGNKLPSPAACPACMGADCTTAFDSVNFKMRIRVPTNALSFSYRFKFYSAEYPEYVCGQYNDFFLALLKSQAAGLPVDGNVAFDAKKNPVSVNNSFLEVCYPTVGAPAGACPSGTLELVGTGMGGWSGDLRDGGGTVWLVNEAPVVGGETIEVQFMVWDAGDGKVDSTVLLDNFRWSLDAASVEVHK